MSPGERLSQGTGLLARDDSGTRSPSSTPGPASASSTSPTSLRKAHVGQGIYGRRRSTPAVVFSPLLQPRSGRYGNPQEGQRGSDNAGARASGDCGVSLRVVNLHTESER